LGAQVISRSKSELHCLNVARSGRDPSHAEKVATIISDRELKGYMLQLHRENRLDDDAKAAIQHRLLELETFFGRKIA
jgi:hypothetical protein